MRKKKEKVDSTITIEASTQPLHVKEDKTN